MGLENAEETEACQELGEVYGKDYIDKTCYEHDKLREWSKVVKGKVTA